jgi:hypothetical protein
MEMCGPEPRRSAPSPIPIIWASDNISQKTRPIAQTPRELNGIHSFWKYESDVFIIHLYSYAEEDNGAQLMADLEV